MTRPIGLYRSTINSEQRLNWCFISGFPKNALFNIYTRGLYCATEEAKVFNIYFQQHWQIYFLKFIIILLVGYETHRPEPRDRDPAPKISILDCKIFKLRFIVCQLSICHLSHDMTHAQMLGNKTEAIIITVATK